MDEVDEMVQCSQVDPSTGFIASILKLQWREPAGGWCSGGFLPLFLCQGLNVILAKILHRVWCILVQDEWVSACSGAECTAGLCFAGIRQLGQ